VESVSLGSDSAGQTATLNVAPAFDVPPDSTSKLILSRAYWQNVTVNNYVDQRAPTCTKANTRGGGSGGALTWYASTADSVMAGNQQYDTSGILLNHTYQPSQSSGIAAVVLQSANEVSDNLISGDYHWNNAGGSQGGIQLGYGATAYFCSGNTCPAPQPPDLGFGVSIAWNTIIQADATDSASGHLPVGAIGSRAVWNTGPIDASGMNEWNLGDATLIFHNTLQNISDTLPDSTPNVARVGIGFDIARGTTTNPPVSWRSALYANSCSTVDVPVSDFGLGLVRYCPATGSGTCECSGISNADVGITARRNHLSAAAGGSVTYSVSIINYDTANSASAVTLFVEPSAGVSLDGSTFTASAGACDGSTNVCKLGNLAAGQSVTVCVVGSLLESGKWPVTFSVSHREADNVPGNDGVTVVASVQ
jgi:hypothetical protein